MYRKNPKGWLKHWDFILLELILFQVSFFIAYIIRHGIDSIFQSEGYRVTALIIFFVDIFTLFFFDSFKDVLRRGKFKEFTATVKHNFIVVAVCALALFAFKRADNTSRLVILYAGLINIIISYGVRLVHKKILRNIMSTRMYRTLLVIAPKNHMAELLQYMNEKEFHTHRIVGCVITDDNSMIGEKLEGVEVVCSLEDAPDYAGREWVDEVFLAADPTQPGIKPMWRRLSETGIIVHFSMAAISTIDNRPQIAEQFAGLPVLTTSINYVSTKQMVAKRIMDILGGLVGSLLTILLSVIFGPFIFFSSPGNIFFTQERIGKNGKRFRIIKFRTMYKDAEKRKKELMEQNNIKDGLMFKMDFDPRIIGNKILPDGTQKTGIGQFLRNHSIDEFPQFFNVLMGQMSLVGTRPPTPDEWDKYKLHHRARLAIKPGVTGLWQVSGRSSITDFEEVVKLDTEYISNWTIGGDLKIIMKTIGVVFTGDGAK